jgi:hypothetical protein
MRTRQGGYRSGRTVWLIGAQLAKIRTFWQRQVPLSRAHRAGKTAPVKV